MSRTRNRRQTITPDEGGPTYLPAVAIADIEPYEFNPRDNAAAIAGVQASIQEFGFMIPIVIDSDNILVAGHTRVEAAKNLNLTHVPGMLADHLTPDQIKAFRIIDNRVAEMSTWDADLLAQEITGLKDSGITLEDYWTQEELDCLSEVVEDDCLSGGLAGDAVQGEGVPPTGVSTPERTRVVIGEFVFYMSRDSYRLWSNAIKEENDFEENRIVEDLKNRLDMTRYA